MAENISNLGNRHRTRNPRVTNEINSKRLTARHIIKMSKGRDKGRISKLTREKQLIKYKETSIRFQQNFAG